MPFIPGDLPLGTLIMGLTPQNYNLLMGASGMICGFIIILVWSRGL